MNSLWIWAVGLELHDMVGRGNFIAIYLASGVVGTWASMVWHVSRGVLITSTLGASGAVFGIVSALCFLLPKYVRSHFPPTTAGKMVRCSHSDTAM